MYSDHSSFSPPQGVGAMGFLMQSAVCFSAAHKNFYHRIILLLCDFVPVSVVMAITGPRVPGRWPLSFKSVQLSIGAI